MIIKGGKYFKLLSNPLSEFLKKCIGSVKIICMWISIEA